MATEAFVLMALAVAMVGTAAAVLLADLGWMSFLQRGCRCCYKHPLLPDKRHASEEEADHGLHGPLDASLL